MSSKIVRYKSFPNYLKVKVPFGVSEEWNKNALSTSATRKHVEKGGLHTVCQEAACPNLSHCWAQGTATFMIMGDHCTRRCGFCNVSTGRPLPLQNDEAESLADAVFTMGIQHVVITSVDRDDLKDCGSTHFAQTIRAVRQKNPQTTIEVLIPDFKAKVENLERIWEAKPNIINHNVETVPDLYKSICPQSHYQNSLEVLKLSHQRGFITKSGIILGLGERFREICEVINDLIACGVKILTIGQYLQPTIQHAHVKKYFPLSFFRRLKQYALKKGMGYVEAGPLVRSSYHAKESFEKFINST